MCDCACALAYILSKLIKSPNNLSADRKSAVCEDSKGDYYNIWHGKKLSYVLQENTFFFAHDSLAQQWDKLRANIIANIIKRASFKIDRIKNKIWLLFEVVSKMRHAVLGYLTTMVQWRENPLWPNGKEGLRQRRIRTGWKTQLHILHPFFEVINWNLVYCGPADAIIVSLETEREGRYELRFSNSVVTLDALEQICFFFIKSK